MALALCGNLRYIFAMASTHSFWKRNGVVLGVAAAVFLIKALYLLTTPALALGMTSWIIDDSFIIMRVAKNIAAGLGFTYNGIDPTTGAPPFWTYLTALNHVIFPFDRAIQMTFVLSEFFAALSTLLTFAIALRVTKDRMIAWVAFILATFTANAFFEAMNGMDTALFTFCVVLTVAAYMGVGMDRIKNTWLRGALISIPAGLSMLVRGDGVFIVGAVGLVLLVDLFLHKSKRTQTLHMLVGFCLVCAAFFALLIGWQVIRTGSPFLANQVGRREIALAWHGMENGVTSAAAYVKIVIWNVFQMERLLTVAIGSSLLALVALLYGLKQKDTRTFSVVTTVYCSVFLGMLVAYQWYFPDFHGLRYLNPAVHLLCVSVAVLFVRLLEKKIWIGLATAATLILSGYAFYDLLNHMPWAADLSLTGRPTQQQLDTYWAPYRWPQEHLPAGTVVGVRDHGRFALFTDLPVQDLAGNIDPMMPLKVKEGDKAVYDYLKSKNVQYLFIPSLEQRSDNLYTVLHRALKLQLVQGAPSTYNQNLYRIIWSR